MSSPARHIRIRSLGGDVAQAVANAKKYSGLRAEGATDHAHDCLLHSFTLEFLLRNATRQRDPTEQSIGISSSEWCKAANVHWKQKNASSSPVRARSKADGILSELDTTSLTRPDLTMTSWRRFECNVLGHKLSSIVHTKHSSRIAQCWAASISCNCLRHSQ